MRQRAGSLVLRQAYRPKRVSVTSYRRGYPRPKTPAEIAAEIRRLFRQLLRT